MPANKPLRLEFEPGRVYCDSELFENLLDKADILGMCIDGAYPPGKETDLMIRGIIRAISRLRRRYENLQVAYYADAWASDEDDPATDNNQRNTDG